MTCFCSFFPLLYLFLPSLLSSIHLTSPSFPLSYFPLQFLPPLIVSLLPFLPSFAGFDNKIKTHFHLCSKEIISDCYRRSTNTRTPENTGFRDLVFYALTDGNDTRMGKDLRRKIDKCRFVDLIQFLLVNLPRCLILRMTHAELSVTLLAIVIITPTRQFVTWFLCRIYHGRQTGAWREVILALFAHIYFAVSMESCLWITIFLLKCTQTLWPFIYMIAVVINYLPLLIPDIFIRDPRKYLLWYILGWIFIISVPCSLYLIVLFTTPCIQALITAREGKIPSMICANGKIFPLTFVVMNAILFPAWWYVRLRATGAPADIETVSEASTKVTQAQDDAMRHPHSCFQWFLKRIEIGAIINLALFWVDIYSSLAASLLFFDDGKYLWSALLLTLLSSGGVATAFRGLMEAPTTLEILWPKNKNKVILAHLLFQAYPIYLCEKIIQRWKGLDRPKLSSILIRQELHWTFFQRQ